MPAWSPDGAKIAFTRTTHDGARLFLIRPNGSDLKQMTTTSAWNPSWSPDGKRLVFDDGHRIAVVDAEGGHLRHLSAATGHDADPAWSPDGRTIAFVRYRSATSQTGDIWLMNPTGGSLTLLVKNASQPDWNRG